MANEAAQHPIHKLALAKEHLQFVLDHPADGLDLERVRLALALITFVRTQQERGGHAEGAAQAERRTEQRRG